LFVVRITSTLNTNTLCRQNSNFSNLKLDGTCSYHWASERWVKKGKAVPLQAWIGPEGSRKLRFPDFMTTARDGGKVVSLTYRPPLPPRNTPDTHFC